MKTLISLAMATFVLGFIFSADLVVGEEETEKMLINQGWVKLSVEELMELKNHTGVGEGLWAFYVDPTGTIYVQQYGNGAINKAKRKITLAAEVCLKFETVNELCGCRSVWKRGKFIVHLKTEDGTLGPEYEIKTGNTENL